MSDRPDLRTLLDDVRAEHLDLVALVTDRHLDAATPAVPWDVRDTVAHLAGTDVEATKAVTDPTLFLAELPAVAQNVEGFLRSQLTSRRALSRGDLLSGWRAGLAALLDALTALPAGTKVPWYGPPMSPASFATARLMEYWAHGQDVADGLAATRTPTARLRHICHLGVQTYGFAYAIRGLDAPGPAPSVRLLAPDGGTWEWGSGDDAVEGAAVDFCLRVTQRRHRDDTGLVATGPRADAWLNLAQCFAGPPGPGRGRA